MDFDPLIQFNNSLVKVIIIFHLNYCNSLLTGLPTSVCSTIVYSLSSQSNLFKIQERSSYSPARNPLMASLREKTEVLHKAPSDLDLCYSQTSSSPFSPLLNLLQPHWPLFCTSGAPNKFSSQDSTTCFFPLAGILSSIKCLHGSLPQNV